MHQSSFGKLGVLYLNGRQVGGFLDWEIEVMTYPIKKGNLKASKLSQLKITALKFWMLEKVNADSIEAIFYCFNGLDLKQVSQNKIKVNLPSEYPLDQLISTSLVMYG